MKRQWALGLAALFCLSGAFAKDTAKTEKKEADRTPQNYSIGPLRADGVDNEGSTLEYLYVNAQNQPIWTVQDIGANLENEPLRSICIRRQADELRLWVNMFEKGTAPSYMTFLKAKGSSHVPRSKISIDWKKHFFPHTPGGDNGWAGCAVKMGMYLFDWNGIAYNNVALTVAPKPTPAGNDCDIVTTQELEYFFGMIGQCVLKNGANCRKFEGSDIPKCVQTP